MLIFINIDPLFLAPFTYMTCSDKPCIKSEKQKSEISLYLDRAEKNLSNEPETSLLAQSWTIFIVICNKKKKKKKKLSSSKNKISKKKH